MQSRPDRPAVEPEADSSRPYVVQRSDERPGTTTDWLRSRHSFSFGDNYDPDNTHHGMLLAVNEETVSPRAGFDTHPHAETEIITWVLEGALVHQDSEGNSGVVYPGLAQRMSAGTGVAHSERNDRWPGRADSGEQPVRFVQMWVMPDEHGLDPSYAQHEVQDELTPGRLVPIASGAARVDSAIRIANRHATLYAGRLAADSALTVPAARYTMAMVTRGSVCFDGQALTAGDAIRADDIGGGRLTAADDAEVLIWAMDRRLGEV